MSELQLSLIAN